MFGLRRKNRPVYVPEIGCTIRTLEPRYGGSEGVHFISIPAKDIPVLADKYFAAMETEVSADWCRCEWIIHPDDGEVKAGTCRQCGVPKDKHWPTVKGYTEETHGIYLGKRMKRGEEAPDCPVHTRAGMLIYFFEWIFTNAAD